ncbi:hypothetical protein C9374_014615 [Naegleria lovaniensis]|uniref:Uncharacterized protein n=1 Tax=Naegleria lovaniensis TaxID=51637 RepID=A0AA88KMQ6_NAELO|nr:uncharacterized protein C9374_014615 [Naegleria lovaniensis]KAG2389215.1 hypothetical protein C9374_014615 [Naegleria lovaniensis]
MPQLYRYDKKAFTPHKQMVKQFVIILEKITTVSEKHVTEVANTIRCSDPVFEELFGIPYPENEKICSVDVDGGDIKLVLYWGTEREGHIKTAMPVTLGSWTLFTLLDKHGFELLEQRNYLQVKDERFKGRMLVERVFVRNNV